MKVNHHTTPAKKRAARVRAKMIGTAAKPRITVYRSNQHTAVQAINDEKGLVIAASHSKSLSAKSEKQTKTKLAQVIGEELGKAMKAKKITAAIFDRGSYKFHGRVKAVAEGLRQQGVKV